VTATGMNKGGTYEAAGIRFTMVHAEHSGAVTLTGGGPTSREVGCWGWVIHFEDDTCVYHTGDTDLFGDMALIGSHFKVDLMLACIGDHFTMGPDRAAEAAKLVHAKQVVPMHFGTFPVLTGTPDAFGKALKKSAPGTKLTVMEVGKTITL
jgi:L-ascorbate metabolism protein UlaG (beta-lactamase superfamily)